MIYRIVTYDRTSERMKGSLVVPPSVLAKVKGLWIQGGDDGLGEYPLDEAQTKQVAKILGFRPEADKFYYSVEGPTTRPTIAAANGHGGPAARPCSQREASSGVSA